MNGEAAILPCRPFIPCFFIPRRRAIRQAPEKWKREGGACLEGEVRPHVSNPWSARGVPVRALVRRARALPAVLAPTALPTIALSHDASW